jgi:hypothetical protein
MDKEELKDYILKQAGLNAVVIMTIEGIQTIDLDAFIKQPAEGILYDLNRDPVTVLTFLENPKWINDYACGLVITKLKNKLKETIKKKNKQIARWKRIAEMD